MTRPGALAGRGSDGRRPSGMLYVRDAAYQWAREYREPIEEFAHRIGARTTEHGSIQVVDLTARKVEPSPPPPAGADDRLAVLCWCEAAVVRVSPAEVQRGLTRPCIRRGCGPEIIAKRAAEAKAVAAWRRKIDRWSAETAGVPHNGAVVWTNTGGTFT